MKNYFELKNDKSLKFWEITSGSKDLKMHYSDFEIKF